MSLVSKPTLKVAGCVPAFREKPQHVPKTSIGSYGLHPQHVPKPALKVVSCAHAVSGKSQHGKRLSSGPLSMKSGSHQGRPSSGPLSMESGPHQARFLCAMVFWFRFRILLKTHQFARSNWSQGGSGVRRPKPGGHSFCPAPVGNPWCPPPAVAHGAAKPLRLVSPHDELLDKAGTLRGVGRAASCRRKGGSAAVGRAGSPRRQGDNCHHCC